jgi:iron complex outermembrane receptor protein
MYKIFGSVFMCLVSIATAIAQDQAAIDSAKILNEVVIQAYAYKRPAEEVPAAVAVVSQNDFERFSNSTLLPTANTIPGVRMEERSPGSYRFSIRGSLLRSPFGVRNVKVYWNGLPFTDGGGNTYLNVLDFSSIGSMEIIKGPGGSLYGAGTGGVILLQTPPVKQSQLQISAIAGSYGLRRWIVSGDIQTKKTDMRFQYSRQRVSGYREQTAMRRDGLQGELTFRLSPTHTLASTVFYTDLTYQTPGGLNKAQYDADPKQARPPSPVTRGAVEQQAAVFNKTGYIGFSDDVQWNESWSTQTGIYGSFTSFENPTIRNYESRDEQNLGVRTQTQYVFEKSIKSKITFGGEYQYFNSPITVYGNTYGIKDTVQTDDKLKSNLLLFFAQAEFDLPHQFYLTLGASANFLKYGFTTLYPVPDIEQTRNFDPEFSPRIALLKKFNSISIYGSVSRGFSPPSLAEVRPSAGTYNNDLNPERGINYEIGFRGNLAKRQVQYELSAYQFKLNETIVIQRTADGAEYFVNAGETSQRGLEAKVSWTPNLTSGFITGFTLWSSYTYNHYRFVDYENDGNDFSGNRLTGVAPTIVIGGLDLNIKKFYLNITANYTDAIPLNDANTAYASEYFLLGGRLGYRSIVGKNFGLDIFTGVDNALDKRYSLGNDLNAVGGRYYNAAPLRNFYVGFKLTPSLFMTN